MSPSIKTIPNELKTSILSYVTSFQDCQNMRYISADWDLVVRERIFKSVFIPHKDCESRKHTVRKHVADQLDVLVSNRIRNFIKKLEWEENSSNLFTKECDKCLSKLNIDKLLRLLLDVTQLETAIIRFKSGNSSRTMQPGFFTTIFDRSTAHTRLATTIRGLGIGEINVSKENWPNSGGFISSLRELEHLELSFTHGTLESFADLPLRWIVPASSTLVHLDLSSDDLWGWETQVDLRPIRLPNLQILCLYKYSFSHKWQFAWILDHANTLRVLYLTGCTILRSASVVNSHRKLSSEGYIIQQNPKGGHPTPDEQQRTYGIYWVTFFDDLKERMHSLRMFQFVDDYRRHPMNGPHPMKSKICQMPYADFHDVDDATRLRRRNQRGWTAVDDSELRSINEQDLYAYLDLDSKMATIAMQTVGVN